MAGEDLSVIFDGKRPPPRPHFTSCYDDHVLAGDYDWFFIADSDGIPQAPLRQDERPAGAAWTWPAEHPELVDKYWRILEDEAGGTLPQFSRQGRQGA